MSGEDPILAVEELRTQFPTERGLLKAVDGVSFALRRGRTLCIVGESGSGKSAMALSLLRLIEPPGRIVSGSVRLQGRDLMAMPEAELQQLRGNRIGMVFQNPMTALNPALRIGEQIAESLVFHRDIARAEAQRQAVELLRRVGIPEPARRARDYPHQFSGGMRQRALIAGAIACGPEVLIADEPTTALDVTIQAQILRLLRDLQRQSGMALILITHDLGVVAAMADEVLVMYAGKPVEIADVETLFAAPRHPYTRGLLASALRLDEARGALLPAIKGNPPRPVGLPPGCSFRSRCDRPVEACAAAHPALRPVGAGHLASCHRLPEA